MDHVDVSVIVPCRNASRFVLECLRSIVSQTLACREIIVADDASTDGSAALVRRHFPTTDVLEGPFGGASAARNAALARSRGTWVAFVDADDRWDAEHLERALSLLQESGDAAYLGHFDALDEAGQRYPVATLPELTSARMHLGLEDFLRLFQRGLPNGSASYVVQRAAITAIDGFDADQIRANDLDFWLRLISGHRWCYDPQPAVCYRLRSSGNLSQDVASRSYFRLRAFLQLGAAGLPESPPLRELIAYWARQAVRTAATRGSGEDWERAWRLGAAEAGMAYSSFWRLVFLARQLSHKVSEEG